MKRVIKQYKGELGRTMKNLSIDKTSIGVKSLSPYTDN